VSHYSANESRAKSVPGLTDLSVRNLPEGLHLDARLPSFGIRVGKKGRTWIVIKGQNRTKISLGHYPALSLADARKRAMLELAKPPSASETAVMPSYPEALAEFHTMHVANLRPRSGYQLSRNLTRHFEWTKPLDQITHYDVLTALDALKPGVSERMPSKIFALSLIGAFHDISNRHLASASRNPLRSRAIASWLTMNCAKCGIGRRKSGIRMERLFSFLSSQASGSRRSQGCAGNG
jgi:hypothetical protein